MKQFTPLATGVLLLLVTLPVLFFSVSISKIYDKSGPKLLMFTGFFLFLIAFLLQSLLEPTFWTVSIGCLIIGFAWVIAWGPSITSALSSIPHHLAGIASGMFTTVQEVSAVVSLAIAGVFFRSVQTAHLMPEREDIQSALSKNSPGQIESLISNPAVVESQLGPSAPILPLLQEAFLSGYQASFWFCVGLSLFAILMTAFLPKHQSDVK